MKKAVVVGASSGIGREVAKRLAKDGWAVGVGARRVDKLEELRLELAASSAHLQTAAIDVTDPGAPAQLRLLINELGGMDLFFYASGIGKQNRDLCEDIELSTMQTNVLGFTRMVGEAYRYFSEVGGGHIAAISSIAGTKGLGPAPAYSASKALQNVYLQALEQQSNVTSRKIRFTDIRPGFVDTALLSGDFRYPMMLKPEKVAKEIVWAINHKKHVWVIDWKYRILTPLWRMLPRWIWRRVRL